MQRHLPVVRRGPRTTAQIPATPLHEARPTDLLSLRLVLLQYLEELRVRGVDQSVLRPIEAELHLHGESIDQLAATLDA